ncbi:acyltransferase family protein [Paenisporosarcina indica]|uniref:acyltransferase family protein n=1 Tax=Paenisporosarcina indica TaxID=650093 RepID=UPI0009503285|nr:acyltransferase [Paenisporosarcina indica]
MNKKRIESLDSLRGVAALIVVIFHCLTSYVIFYNANNHVFENKVMEVITLSPLKIVWAGNEAVLLFFVLSGFVLSLPVFNGKPQLYSAYIVKRFFRIYIPYIVIMLVSTLLAVTFFDFKENAGLSEIYENRWDHQVTLKAFVSFLFMIPEDLSNVNGVVWSLFHEMRISIVFPLFVLIIYKYKFIKSFTLSMALIIFGIAFFQGLKTLTDNEFVESIWSDFTMSAWFTVFFVCGSILAKYRNRVEFINRTKWWVKLGVFVFSLILINSKGFLIPLNLNFWMIEQGIALIGIIILFVVILNSDLADKLLTRKPLLWLGKVSYSLYLVHVPVIMVTTILLRNIITLEWSFVVAVILSLVVAEITYKWVEAPTIKIGKRLSDLIINRKRKQKS